MILLHILHELSQKNKWQLAVAHLNHRLRGRSSGADERLVLRVAKILHLPIITSRADVEKIARTGGLSLEMAARKARHEFLAQTARRLKISHVALAHHADDQVELFFLRLLRGSGSEGLAGMKWRGPSPADPKIQLVRPLLEQSKESLLDYATAKRIPFREDASNASLDIQRNLIRRELLPLLRRKYQPALSRTILRVMDILKAESEFMCEASESATGVSPVRWKLRETLFPKLPLALQRRSLQSQLLKRGIPADFALVERLRTSPGQPFMIVPQVTVACDAKGQLHFQNSPPVVSKTDELKIHLEGRAGQASFAGRKIFWSIRAQKTFRHPGSRPRMELFDADKISSRIVLRHWQPGDRFQPIGMKQPVKLQDFFVNQKISRARRHELIVAATHKNEVFWVEDLRISEQFKLTSATSRRLIWQWK